MGILKSPNSMIEWEEDGDSNEDLGDRFNINIKLQSVNNQFIF